MRILATAFVIGFLPVTPALAQTIDELRREASQEYVEIADNSQAALLWRSIVGAKQSGNEILHSTLVQQFKQQFPERFSIVPPILNGPAAVQSQSDPVEGGTPDWGPGDVRINPGAILSPTGVGSGRSVQIEADSSGNKYAAYIIGTGDTLVVYKSTDQGLTWVRIVRITPGLGAKWHSFDFFVTDSLNGFRLGFAAVRTSGNYAGDIFWMFLNDDGTGFRATQVQTRTAGRGFINPAIVSDGFLKSAGTTYWYMVYESVDSASGVCNAAVTGLSLDWGQTWQLDTARSTFNDYDLDIEYKNNGDSIVVLLSNDLTVTNPNLRLRQISLANYGIGTWSQFNPATTASPEDQGSLVINRQTNEMLVMYTLTQSGNKNIAYSYTSGGGVWVTGAILTALANNEDRARADCQESQGAYRLCYVSSGTSYDTVIYYSAVTLAGGFSGRRIVNEQSTASTSIVPDVAGFRQNASSFGGGVVFAGASSTGAYYDGSNITTSFHTDADAQPVEFALAQNFPNPFNPSTTIRFSIPVTGVVRLAVFDVLGKEVATVVNRVLQRGNHAATFDVSRLSSGTYFYRLQSSGLVQTKKLLILR